MDEEEPILAELFRANDPRATIVREHSMAIRIDGTFNLKQIADGFATVVLRPLTPTDDGLAYLHATIRAARAAGEAIDEPQSTFVDTIRQPTMDDGELLAEAFRANRCFASVTREEGSEVTRVDGTFNLEQIAVVFSSLIKDRYRREIFLRAPRDPEEVLEELRSYVAPYA